MFRHQAHAIRLVPPRCSGFRLQSLRVFALTSLPSTPNTWSLNTVLSSILSLEEHEMSSHGFPFILPPLQSLQGLNGTSHRPYASRAFPVPQSPPLSVTRNMRSNLGPSSTAVGILQDDWEVQSSRISVLEGFLLSICSCTTRSWIPRRNRPSAVDVSPLLLIHGHTWSVFLAGPIGLLVHVLV
jgi:hypothetical protein